MRSFLQPPSTKWIIICFVAPTSVIVRKYQSAKSGEYELVNIILMIISKVNFSTSSHPVQHYSISVINKSRMRNAWKYISLFGKRCCDNCSITCAGWPLSLEAVCYFGSIWSRYWRGYPIVKCSSLLLNKLSKGSNGIKQEVPWIFDMHYLCSMWPYGHAVPWPNTALLLGWPLNYSVHVYRYPWRILSVCAQISWTMDQLWHEEDYVNVCKISISKMFQ